MAGASIRCLFALLQQWGDLLLRGHARHLDIALQDEQVDLAAYAKPGQVDARLHRAAGTGQQGARVLRLVVIQIGPVAMHMRYADAVARAVHEIVPVARLSDNAARNIIDLPSLDALAGGQALTDEGNARIACAPHNLKNLALRQWDLIVCAGKGHPGIVSENRVGLRHLRHEIEEDQIAAPERATRIGRWRVVRIAGISVHRYVRWIIRHQPRLPHQVPEALLDAI